MAIDGKIGNIDSLFQAPIMAVYKVHVTTGDALLAGTNDHVFVTLVGTDGESERTALDNYGLDFCSNQVRNYSLKSDIPPGFSTLSFISGVL